MMKRAVTAFSLALVLGFTAFAHATTFTYNTILKGANEVPPIAVPGTGVAIFTLTDNMLGIDLTFSGLTGPALAGHIHCCAGPASTAIVAVPFSGLPSGTSGHYVNTIDLTLLASYNPMFVTANGGTAASAEAAVIAGLNSGNTYANLHTPAHPGGEIRGQIAATPEPGSILLLGTGLIGVAEAVRRRLKTAR